MQSFNCAISRPSCPALTLAKYFVQRWDIHAHQLVDGHYICIHEPLHIDHIFAHLFGEITLGIYLLNQNSEARFVVIDVDDEQGFNRLLFLAKVLAGENVPSYLEESRRGGHLWMFLRESVPGREARAFAKGLLATHQVDNVEIFPKQDKLTGGPGSLIRMPYGVYRLTGRRYDFFTPDGSLLAPTILEQIHDQYATAHGYRYNDHQQADERGCPSAGQNTWPRSMPGKTVLKSHN